MARDAPAEIGKVIGGRYVLEEQLGLGGAATVYRASELRTGHKLALKRSQRVSQRTARKRRSALEREFHTLAQLAHPCIIEVYDYGVDDDIPYYTMELLDGADLHETGRLPWREAAALLRDVASSLAILHSRGLLHRDVSATNVRRTADGRAKLLDFGAMASLGVVSEVIGTPPFVAPEVLQMQALDARSDLFSLGALAYYTLTGRHAYPARRLNDLRDIWRSKPFDPSRLTPELPEALSQLIMQLLSLDRSARPQHAAEVMARLCAIADLPEAEIGAVSRSYLFAPTLVGRDPQLLEVSRGMLDLLRGQGGSMMVLGPSGSGRSRLLDACVLEAKLLGAQVLRAPAADSDSGDWGVARALGNQLHEVFPEASAVASRFSAEVIGQVIDALRASDVASAHEPFGRARLLRELRDYTLAVTRGQRVVMVVDDVDRIDEPSAALLAALSDKLIGHGILLVTSMDAHAERRYAPPLSLLHNLARVIDLAPLDGDDTRKLLRSVFGDVPRLSLCAARIQTLANGSPRTIMELAQHLVDRGLVRYQGGAWVISAALDGADLPATLAASLGARIDQLGHDARELADVLSLAHESALALSDYPALTSHGDSKRTFTALQELVAARVLVAAPEGSRFSQVSFLDVIQQKLTPDRSLQLHARLADVLATVRNTQGDVLRRAHHLLSGGRGQEAVRLLCRGDVFELLGLFPPLELLGRAIDSAERDPDLPPRALQQLRVALLSKAPFMGAIESFRRYLPYALEILVRDSGLSRYYELASLPPEQRLQQALADQQARYLATPEHERVYSIPEAIRELAQLAAATGGIAVIFMDLSLVERLPSLTPLLPLSPALVVVQMLIDGSIEMIAGRGERVTAHYEKALAALRAPDRAGFEPMVVERMEASLTYALGVVEAMYGNDNAERRAEAIEPNRAMRGAAWRVRMVMNLSQGDVDAARKCARRAEMLQLQDSNVAYFGGTTAGFELIGFAALGDLLGVEASLEAVAGWPKDPSVQVMENYGRSRDRELQGDLNGALAAAEQAMALIAPGRHMCFGVLAASHVRILGLLGREAEALQLGREYLAAARELELTPAQHQLALEVALLAAISGEVSAALSTLEPAIAAMERLGASGFTLGRFYETRARVALIAGEEVTFRNYIERTAAEYQRASNPNLHARLSRLVEQADHHQLRSGELARQLASSPPMRRETQTDSLHARLLECVDKNDRARCVLSWLLASSDGARGYLFGIDGARATLLAGLPDPLQPPGLASWVEQRIAAEQAVETTQERPAMAPPDTTRSRPITDDEVETEYLEQSVWDNFSDAQGRSYEAHLLVADRGDRRACLAAVLVLEVSLGIRRRPPQYLLQNIAVELLDQQDVVGADL